MSAAENKAVFLSYASQDAAAVSRIAEALRAAGVEVWFDQNELVGGDAWDQKIRRQIKECAIFVPVISANTQARTEGYFRLEWRLADQRTHHMAKGRAFLLPIVIDETRDAEAHVPDSFTEVQWTRLPGGETPEKFCARVKKLIEGEGRDASPRRPSSDADEKHGRLGETSLPPKPSRPWLVPAIMVAAAALFALALWQPWRGKEKSAPANSPTGAIAPGAPLTDAQQLVAKARKIFDEGDEMNRETYTFAEELLKKAETLDVAEGSAWALHAQVSAQSYLYGLDNSPTRREAMLAESARAAKLMPDSMDAVLASANVRLASRQEIPALAESFKKLAEANPQNPQVLRVLVKAYGLDGKADDASDTARRALHLAPDDPRFKADLVNYLRINNRFAEAEAALTEAKNGRMNARLWAFDSWLKLFWRGDSAGASASIRSWPSWFFLEDRGAALAAVVFMWNREPAKAIEVLGNFPRDEIEDTMAAGPRAAFTAMAREQLGQNESVRADWRVALQVADRKLGTAPDDAVALHWKAWALARLGDLPAASAIFNQLREKSPVLPSSLYLFGGLASLAETMGRSAEVINYLQPSRFNGTGFERPLTKGILRLNPVFDPLRSDPRFLALIDAAPGLEEKKENQTSSVAPAVSEKSLVVLPLENLSPDPENAIFTEGMHTEIVSNLQLISDLKVVSRGRALAFKGSTLPIAEIAQKLGVANVITGSVRRAGNTVRIQLELRRASDDALLWSLPKGDRDLKDALALQSDVAEQVARVLQARESKGGVGIAAQFMTKDPRAYDLFLLARRAFDTAGQGTDAIAQQCEAVLAIDPNFMSAANLLSVCRTNVARSATDPTERVREAAEAKRWAEAAARMVPGGAGDGALAYYHSQVERDGLRALALAENQLRALPNNSQSHTYVASSLSALGRRAEALAGASRAVELDPSNPILEGNLAVQLYHMHRPAELPQVTERYLAKGGTANNPAIVIARFGLFGEFPAASDLDKMPARARATWLWRARKFADVQALSASELRRANLDDVAQWNYQCLQADACARLERSNEAGVAAREALAAAERLQRVPEVGPSEKPGWLAAALVRVGRTDEAIAAARRAVEIASPESQLALRWEREIALARIFAYANRSRECVELLAGLLRVPSGITVPMLRAEPDWDNMREDAAFKALLADPKNSAPL